MTNNLGDYINFFIGSNFRIKGEGEPFKLVGVSESEVAEDKSELIAIGKAPSVEGEEDVYVESYVSEIELLLTPISKMQDEQIIALGKYVCAIPNSPYPYKTFIQRYHNATGIKYLSDGFTSGNFYSMSNEKNKPETIGHIEIGWYSTNGKYTYKDRTHWKIGGNHHLTMYCMKQGIDIFGLIGQGLAKDKTTI